MSESTTVVSLPNMVDLALNSPEVGIVNFTVLHSLLHVIVHQLNLTDINVEFRGTDSERLQSYIKTAKPGPLLTLTEYVVGPDSVDAKGKDDKKKAKGGDEKGKKDEAQKEKKEAVPVVDSEADNKSTVVLVKSSKGSEPENPQFTVVVTKNHFDKLEGDIHKLDQRIKELAELPANSALIQAIRTEDNQKMPVLEVYQILNLTKRLDAAEVTMEKLASMMEDIAKKGPLGGGGGGGGGSDDEEEGGVMGRIKKLEDTVFGGGDGKAEGGDVDSTDLSKMPPQKAVQILQQALLGMKNTLDALAEALKELEDIKKMFSPGGDSKGGANMPPEARINQLELKFNDCIEQLNSLDNMYSRQMNTLTKRLDDLEKQFGEIMEKVHLGLPGGDGQVEGQNMSDLYAKLMQLQEDMNAVTEAAEKLMDEKNDRQHTIDVLNEQVELLKTVKADKEELEDALADKADACMVNRKVSLEQFDATCGDMTRAIEDTLEKLAEQHNLWTQALDEIQANVGNKLDRTELTPLRDFINSKLKSLQDKLRALASLKKDNEAAGSKSKMLKNVNCISCDKDVVMRKQVDSSLYPKPYALPPNRSMAPYLAYELDQLRKQQKCAPNSKNLIGLENATQSARSARGPDNLCNRYCGGSHTTTTPQQRVTRLGHFLEQWGPEIAPANDQNIRGTDGRMYKGRDDKALREMAQPPLQAPMNASESFAFPSAHGEAMGAQTSREGMKAKTSVAGMSSVPKPGTEASVDAYVKSPPDMAGHGSVHSEVPRKSSVTESARKSASKSSTRGSKTSVAKSVAEAPAEAPAEAAAEAPPEEAA